MYENKHIVGLMSGSSLDGLDIVACTFEKKGAGYVPTLICGETVPYPPDWVERLSGAPWLSGRELVALDVAYGRLLATATNAFIHQYKLEPVLISSHGHTIFHQPERGITHQIGDGHQLYAKLGIPTVYNFRALDVAFGGQGAPLVPVGDMLMFGENSYCLNLGGIANISYQQEGKRLAYDVCAFNQVLNHFARKVGVPYDEEGRLASSSDSDLDLLEALSLLPYYHQVPPKSLGREWIEEEVIPLIHRYTSDAGTALATFSLHAAEQLATSMEQPGKILCTGGGTFNSFFIERLQDNLRDDQELIIPSKQVIQFKEALIFAFLGFLRVNDLHNSLSSVTGASENSISGTLIG